MTAELRRRKLGPFAEREGEDEILDQFKIVRPFL